MDEKKKIKILIIIAFFGFAMFFMAGFSMGTGRTTETTNFLPWPVMGAAMGSDPVRAAEFVRSTYDGYSDDVISFRLLCCDSIRVRVGQYLSTVAEAEHLEQITLIGYLHFLRPDRLRDFRDELRTLAESSTRPNESSGEGTTYPRFSLFFGRDVVAAAQYALSAIPPEK